jgi:hypothetical protein
MQQPWILYVRKPKVQNNSRFILCCDNVLQNYKKRHEDMIIS